MPFVDSPTEQTSAVTDGILALLALGCVWYLARTPRTEQPKAWKVHLWSWLFGLLALAAALGAVAHGFKISPRVIRNVWHLLYLSLGLIVALFVVAVVYDLWGKDTARRMLPLMLILGLIFFGITLLLPETFLIFIIFESVAMLFALAAYGWLALKRRLNGAGLMAAGVLITIIAAGVQASQAASITFIWPFDHNGLYHLIQIAGVLTLLTALRVDLLTLESSV